MESIDFTSIKNKAADYLKEAKIENPDDYNNIIRQKINELEMEKDIKERDKRDKQKQLEELKQKDGTYLQRAKKAQTEIIKLQKDLHWMEAQETKERKNEFELDRLLQSQLHKFILAKKYEQIKRLMSRFRSRSKKRSGPSAVIVLRFLEDPLKLTENQKMPYLVIFFLTNFFFSLKPLQ